MAAFEILGTYTNGSIIDGPEIADEFDNIYEAWNGTSTDKEIEHKFSGNPPALIIDQLGSGKILSARVDGVELTSIENTGKIVSPNVLVDKFTWFIADPNSNLSELLKVFIVPDGLSMRITKLSVISRSGDTNPITYTLSKNGTPFGNSVVVSVVDTVDTEVLDEDILPDDIISLNQSFSIVTGFGDVTVLVEWEQRLG